MVEKPQLLEMIYAAWLATLSFVGARLLKSLDSRAGREELTAALERLADHDRRASAARDRIFAKLDELAREQNQTAQAVARLEGRQ